MSMLRNRIYISGTIESDLEFHHEEKGKKYYSFKLKVRRNNINNFDTINILVHNRKQFKGKVGDALSVMGKLESHYDPERKRKLLIYVNAETLILNTDVIYENMVVIEGDVERTPIKVRETPFGRVISDVIISTSSTRDKSKPNSMIPCIFWGKNAIESEKFNYNDRVALRGRIQSRDYVKKYKDGTEEKLTAYELSVSEIIK